MNETKLKEVLEWYEKELLYASSSYRAGYRDKATYDKSIAEIKQSAIDKIKALSK